MLHKELAVILTSLNEMLRKTCNNVLLCIFLVSGISCFQFQKNDLIIKYKVSSFKTCAVIPNRFKLSSVTSVSLNDCVWHCAFRSTCTGLNYKKKFPLCELYTGNEVQEKLGNCVYIKHRDIEVEHSQSDKESNAEKTCDIQGSNAVKECPYPDVANGKSSGNEFSIGSKQTIECNPGYVIHDTNELKCLENGTWEVIRGSWKECSKPVIRSAVVELNICTKPSMTLATVRCHIDYMSNRTTDASNVITEETISCDISGTWSPSIDCIVNNNIQNMAMDKPAYQSSTYINNTAHLATDGIWKTEFSVCTHTDVFVEDTAWWEVDLLQVYSIRRLKILNRKAAASRLHDLTVTVGNHTNPLDVCAFYKGPGLPEEIVELNCVPVIVGQYVRITKPNHNGTDDNLTLCQVGIYE